MGKRNARFIHILAFLTTFFWSGLAISDEIRYTYDQLGRLIGMVAPDGKITLYEYDPVGNLLAIRAPEIEVNR